MEPCPLCGENHDLLDHPNVVLRPGYNWFIAEFNNPDSVGKSIEAKDKNINKPCPGFSKTDKEHRNIIITKNKIIVKLIQFIYELPTEYVIKASNILSEQDVKDAFGGNIDD